MFVIGKDKKGESIDDEETLSKLDKNAYETIGLLKIAGCVGDATDEKLVKNIQAQAKEDAALEDKAKKAVAAGSNANIVQELVAALKAK